MSSPGSDGAQPGANAGLVAVFVAVVCFSLGSTLVKLTGSPGVVVAFWRLLLGTLIWLTILSVQRRHLTAATVRKATPVGVLFGVNLALFFVAVTKTQIANVEFIASLTPILVVPLAAVMFHEHLPTRAMAWGLAAIAGVAVVVFGATGEGSGSRVGDLFAVAAVITWAGYLLTSRQARAELSTAEVMAVAALVATIVVAPFAVLQGGLFEVSAKGWAAIITLAILTGTLGHGLIVWSQARVPVSTISVLTLAQPALAATWAYLFLDEAVTPVQVVGMGIVLGALAMFTLTVQRTRVTSR